MIVITEVTSLAQGLGNEIQDLEAEIQRLTRTAAPAPVDGFGIGPPDGTASGVRPQPLTTAATTAAGGA